MHKLAKEIMERIKSKINSSGIDDITEHELIEMKYWTAIADNMTSFDYHFKIIEEMEKPENKTKKGYSENGRYYSEAENNSYSDNGRFYTVTHPRNNRGEFTRRGYDQSGRDMDMSAGRMYYMDDMRNESRYEGGRNKNDY